MKKFLKILGYPFLAKDFIIGLFPFSKYLSKSAVYGFSTLFRLVIGYLFLFICSFTIDLLVFFGAGMILMVIFHDLRKWISLVHEDQVKKINTVPEYSEIQKKDNGSPVVAALKWGGVVALTIILCAALRTGFTEAKNNKRLASDAVQVTATVTKTDTYHDDNNNTRYRAYVSYEYDGVEVKDKMYGRASSSQRYYDGDVVTVTIDPLYPDEFYNGDDNSIVFGCMLFWLLLFIIMSTIWKKSKISKNHEGKKIISCTHIYNYYCIWLICLFVISLFLSSPLSNPKLTMLVTVVAFALNLIPVMMIGNGILESYSVTVHTVVMKNITVERKRSGNGNIKCKLLYFSSSDRGIRVSDSVFSKAHVGREYYFLNRLSRESIFSVYDTEFWALPTAQEDREITAKMKKTYIARIAVFFCLQFVYFFIISVVFPAIV